MSEYKNKMYRLRNGKSPASYRLQTKSTPSVPLLYFDEKKGIQRALRYAPNHPSPFVDEQQGEVLPADVFFEKGMLFVPREDQGLQQFLEKYHPGRGIVFEEVIAKSAADDFDKEEMETQAILVLASMNDTTRENIAKVIYPGKTFPDDKTVTVMLKRAIRNNPKTFMDAAGDPNTGLKATITKGIEKKVFVLDRTRGVIRWNIFANEETGTKAMQHQIVKAEKGQDPVDLMVQRLKSPEGADDYARLKQELGL